MNNCSFCHTQTQQDICPQCCAPMPDLNCNPINALVEVSKNENYYKVLNNLIPIFTTCILKLYQGPAWLISIFLGTVNALNLNFQAPPKITNKRSFYYVEKLLSTNLIESIFITPEDFLFVKKKIQEISSQLNYQQKHRISFLEIWKVLKSEEFEEKIKKEIKLTYTIYDWPAFFEFLGISGVTTIHINNNFLDHHDSFKDVYFHPHLEELHIQNSNAFSFHSSFWTIRKKIHLENMPYLQLLPEFEGDWIPDSILDINFIQCALTYLPSTITRRCINCIDLSGCKNITKLPLTLQPILQGQIKILNLTDTGIPQEYRKKFTKKILNFPSSMFSNMSSFNTSDFLVKHPLQSNKNIKNAINLLIPVGLVGLTIQKVLQPKNKNIITEKIPFWGAFMTITLGAIAATSQLKKLQYQNAVHTGTNVDAIWVMLNKTGIQKESSGIGVNWDQVWESIFPSVKNWCGTPPLTCFKPELHFIKNFLKSWIDARENTQEKICKDPMTRDMYQFMQENGGQSWSAQISKLPFYEMIYEMEKRSFNYPEIKEYIDGYQKSIGNYNNIDQALVELNLDDILCGCACRPAINFDGIFSLIKSGKNISLKLDWSYQGIKQPLHFHPSSEMHTVDIHNAIIHNVTDDYWLVKHKLSFIDCDGVTQLPKIPKITPRSPLTLELHGLMIERLPDDICNRSFEKISIINCPNFYFLPEEFKEPIKHGVLKHIIIKNSGLQTKKEEYINDPSILEEPIFECCPELPPIKIIESKSWWSLLDTMKFSLIESGISFLFSSIIMPKISKKNN